VGAGAANHELSLDGVGFDGGLSIDGLGGDGAIFSLGAGADYQVNSRVVVGAFFDYDWANIESDLFNLQIGDPVALSASADMDVEDIWSVGGRLGYLVTPSTMLFLTGGYSRADISDISFRATGLGGGTLARVGEFDGYFIGGGAEIKLTKSLSLKGEYRYTDLDSKSLTLLPGTPLEGINDFVTTKLDPDIQTARLALNYRFDIGGHGEHHAAADEAPIGSWSQFYVGAGGGYTFGNNELTLTPGPVLAGFDASLGLDALGSQGGSFTVGIGADRQYDDKFVLGVFADYTRHSNEFEIALNLEDFLSGSLSYEIENEWSIGARAGYLVTPSTLFFGTVGYSHLSLSDTVIAGTIDGIGSGSFVLADNGSFGGVFLGAGIETKLSENLSLKAEYRYLFARSERIDLLPGIDLGGASANDFVNAELSPDIQSMRLSLDYRFNFGGSDPVPLK
jgi:outer membrane immunogenic protein